MSYGRIHKGCNNLVVFVSSNFIQRIVINRNIRTLEIQYFEGIECFSFLIHRPEKQIIKASPYTMSLVWISFVNSPPITARRSIDKNIIYTFSLYITQ